MKTLPSHFSYYFGILRDSQHNVCMQVDFNQSQYIMQFLKYDDAQSIFSSSTKVNLSTMNQKDSH